MNKHIELLRNPPCDQRWYGPDAIMGQAADEIEWLEAELAEATRVQNLWWVECNRLDADNARLNAELDKACKSQDGLRAEAKAVTAEPSDPSPELVKAAEEFAKTIWLTAQWPTAINRQSPTAAAILALCAVMKGELTDGE